MGGYVALRKHVNWDILHDSGDDIVKLLEQSQDIL